MNSATAGIPITVGTPFAQGRIELNSGRPKTVAVAVVVAGAGLAGLAAAFELMQAGHDVRVVEARPRPVYSRRTPAKRGLSRDAIALTSFRLEGDDYDHVSGLQSLAVQSFLAHKNIWFSLRNGNDQLPNAFARRLGRRIRYGAEVVRITQLSNSVCLSYIQGGVQDQLEVDRLIVTIPFSVLRRVELDSSISQNKRNAISTMRYESLLRVFLQCRRRCWLNERLEGGADSDLDIGPLQDQTATQKGSRGIIEALMEHAKAAQAHSMTHTARLEWVLENMNKIHPEFRRHFEGGLSYSWDEDP